MTSLGPDDRAALVRALFEARARPSPRGPRLTPSLDRAACRAQLDALDADTPRAPETLFRWLLDIASRGQLDTAEARYFGPFQPHVSDLAALTELLVAVANPQLAVSTHAPFAIEAEAWVLRAFAARLGLDPRACEGTFTSGGAESNLTAVLLALEAACPAWRSEGVRAMGGAPMAYASAEAHPTVRRALRLVGLGDGALRVIPVDREGRMKASALRAALAADRAAGRAPFLVVATLGTTGLGALDPLAEVLDAAARAGAWAHVDAAYGGIAALAAPALAPFAALSRADSIAFDPHKALAVPLGAGTLLTRRRGALGRVFEAEAGYMPRGADEAEPFSTSLRWSRRANGLATFAMLASEGFSGLASRFRQRQALADHLRRALVSRAFHIVNDTPLPLVCAVPSTGAKGLATLARRAIEAGAGWVSVVRAANGLVALRACVEHTDVTPGELDALADVLARPR